LSGERTAAQDRRWPGYVLWPALAVLAFCFVQSAVETFRDASVVWPSSWALDARWPWWLHCLAAVGFALWIRSTWEKRGR
jgi:hypothetical protein